MEVQERSFKENLAQVQEKMDRERENLLREQQTMLEHKLKVSVDGPGWHLGETLTPQE